MIIPEYDITNIFIFYLKIASMREFTNESKIGLWCDTILK